MKIIIFQDRENVNFFQSRKSIVESEMKIFIFKIEREISFFTFHFSHKIETLVNA